MTKDILRPAGRSSTPKNPLKKQATVTRDLPCNKAYLYLRVSTAEQAESQAGLQAQEDACRAWLQKEAPSYTLGGVFTDAGVSGGSAERPALLELLSLVHLGDIVLVAKRDRLARDVLLARLFERDIENRGGVLRSAAGEGTQGDEPSDKLQRGLIDLFAEYERALIAARIKAAMGAMKKRGQLVGAVPYGKSLHLENSLTDNWTEQLTIQRARELRGEGLSLREISEALATEGRCARNGQPFQATQIKRMLAHE